MYDTMDAAHGVGLAANQIGVRTAAVRLRLCRGPRNDRPPPRCGRQSRPGDLRNPRDHARSGRRRRRLPVGSRRVLPHRPREVGAGHRARRRRRARSPSRAPACSRACCSTKPGTWMAFSTWTDSSAGTPAPRNGRSSRTAGAFPVCRGCPARDRTRSVTDDLVAGPGNAGDGSLPAPRRIGPAADRCGRAPAGGRPGGAGADENRRGRRVRARRRGGAAGAHRRTGARLADPGARTRRRPRPGPASNGPGWTAGCCGPGTASRLSANSAVPLDISAHTGTIPAIVDWYEQRNLTPWLAVPDRLLRLPPGLTANTRSAYWYATYPMSTANPTRPSLSRLARTTLGCAYTRARFRLMCSPPSSTVSWRSAAHPGGAVARAAVTDAPDGTRWVGLSASARGGRPEVRPLRRRLCEAIAGLGRATRRDPRLPAGARRRRDGTGRVAGLSAAPSHAAISSRRRHGHHPIASSHARRHG